MTLDCILDGGEKRLVRFVRVCVNVCVCVRVYAYILIHACI